MQCARTMQKTDTPTGVRVRPYVWHWNGNNRNLIDYKIYDPMWRV